MFKSKKNKTAVLLALLMLGLILTVIVDAQDRTKINFSMFSYAPTTATRKLIPVFEKQFPQIQVAVDEVPYSQLHEKQVIEMSKKGKGTFDLVQIDACCWMPEYVRGNFLAQLNSYVTKDWAWEDFFPAYSDTLCTWNDGIYAIPMSSNSTVFVVRKDVFDKAGIVVPKVGEFHWSDWTNFSKKLTSDWDGNGYLNYGTAMFGLRGCTIVSDAHCLIMSKGGLFFDDKWNIAFNDENGIAMMRQILTLANNGSFPPGISSYAHTELTAAVKNGLVASALYQEELVPDLLDPAQTKFVGKFAFINPPVADNYSNKWNEAQKKIYNRREAVQMCSNLGGVVAAVPSNSTHKKEAAIFLKWLTSKENHMSFVKAGAIPIRSSLFANPDFKKSYPSSEAYQYALEHYGVRPLVPQWIEIEDILGNHLSAMLAAIETPEEALGAAAEEISAIQITPIKAIK